TSTAMMIHVTTTDSEIPPSTGRLKTVSQFSSSINVSVRFPVLLPPFLYHILLRKLFGRTVSILLFRGFFVQKKELFLSEPLESFSQLFRQIKCLLFL